MTCTPRSVARHERSRWSQHIPWDQSGVPDHALSIGVFPNSFGRTDVCFRSDLEVLLSMSARFRRRELGASPSYLRGLPKVLPGGITEADNALETQVEKPNTQSKDRMEAKQAVAWGDQCAMQRLTRLRLDPSVTVTMSASTRGLANDPSCRKHCVSRKLA